MSLLEKTSTICNQKFYIGLSFSVTILSAGLFFFQIWGLASVLLISAILFVIGAELFKNSFQVFINERDIGIVFKNNGDFDSFIDSGKHYLNPRKRKIKKQLRIKGNKFAAQTTVRTKDGVLVTVSWETKYDFNRDVLLNGSYEDKRSWGYSLLNSPFKKVGGITIDALRQVLEQQQTSELYQTQQESGLLNQLEAKVSTLVKRNLQVSDPNSLLANNSGKVAIRMIVLPARIEEAIELQCENILATRRNHPFRFEKTQKSINN